MPPRSGRYGCGDECVSSRPWSTRRRSSRATSRDPSIATAIRTTPDAREERGKPGGGDGHEGREGEDANEEANPDRRVRVPGRRVDRREQERPDRVPAVARQDDPRRSECRSAGDPGCGQPGQDEEQSHDEDCAADHGSSASRRTAVTTRRAPIAEDERRPQEAAAVGPVGQVAVDQGERPEQDQERPEERHADPAAATGLVLVRDGRRVPARVDPSRGTRGRTGVGRITLRARRAFDLRRCAWLQDLLGLERHDDRHHDVEEHAHATEEDREDPQDPDQRASRSKNSARPEATPAIFRSWRQRYRLRRFTCTLQSD